MKLNNPWVIRARAKALGIKLESLLQAFVDKSFTDAARKSIYAIIKQFVQDENMPYDTAFLIKIDKRVLDSNGFGLFKGVSIVV